MTVPLTLRAAPQALTVYDRALLRAAAGRPVLLTVVDGTGGEHPVDPAVWCRRHVPGDAGLLARCAGATLDVGCGPGRLAGALGGRDDSAPDRRDDSVPDRRDDSVPDRRDDSVARWDGSVPGQGDAVLGIDLSRAAIRLARQRGVPALRRDVFGPLPGVGRWRHLLLADGNIGIGGDPVALLRRCRALLRSTGQIHVELAAPGGRSWAGWARLRADGGEPSAPFRWASVTVDDIAAIGATAGLRTRDTWTEAGRWFASLMPA